MLLGISVFMHTFFSPVISSNTYRYLNQILHKFKVLKKVLKNLNMSTDKKKSYIIVVILVKQEH